MKAPPSAPVVAPEASKGPPKPKPVPVTYTVTLLSAGATKLAIVKIIKDATGRGLQEVKDLVDAAPSVVKDGLDLASAEELRKLLADAGAVVEVTASGVAPETPKGPPKPVPGPPGATYTVTLRSAGATKLAVTKIVKDVTGLGLQEAKDLVDAAPSVVKEGLDRASAEDLGNLLTNAGADVEVTAVGGEPQAPASPPGPGAATYAVRLLSGGATRLAIVKIVKDATGLGLQEAKDLVDAAPSVVKDGLSRADAESLARLLSDAGADVEVTATGAEPGPPANPPTPDPLTCTVRLLSGGATRLAIVKIVKDATGLGLQEAKSLVDAAPSVVKDGLSRADAEALELLLRDAGADVEVTQP